MGSELVKPHHLSRKAVIDVRQSTPHQVLTNQESLRLQYALRERAHELGWPEAEIDVIDAGLGLSRAAAPHRQGLKDLVSRVTLDEVGITLSLEVTRLARNWSDWYPLLDVCGYRECLIADRDGVYDPGTANGRLLLGLKGIPTQGLSLLALLQHERRADGPKSCRSTRSSALNPGHARNAWQSNNRFR